MDSSSCNVSQESFEALESYRLDPSVNLDWNNVFTLPVWMKTWWDAFGSGCELSVSTVRRDGQVIGVAPFKVSDNVASLVGSPDVCDYMDFIVSPGSERDFCNAVLDHLPSLGIKRLELHALRPDSAALTHLEGVAEKRGLKVAREQEDVTLETELPDTWEGYLGMLSTKQRHEVRRKLRRLYEAGEISYRVERDRAALGMFKRFIELFTGSSDDKREFLTAQRERFFRRMAEETTWAGMFRIGSLELDGKSIAMVLGFELNGCLYLYNSGFDRTFDELSAGLMSKALFVKWAIEHKMKKFDFLKGSEVYKYRLGGGEIPVFKCNIDLA